MKRTDTNKKVWVKPAITLLNIKKDTFAGSIYGQEQAGKSKTAPIP